MSRTTRSWDRKCLALSFVLTIGTIPHGGVTPGFAKTESNAGIEPGLKITAHIYNYAQVDLATLALAENETARIFQRAGLRIEWRDVPIFSLQSRSIPPDEPALGPTDVFLRIVPSSSAGPLNKSQESLGCALPSSKQRVASDAWVFSDRVEKVAAQAIASRDQILAAAMAHEIGHLLLGLNPHSVEGVMRGDWRREEYVSAAQGRLLFTPHQAQQIRAEVLARNMPQNTTQTLGSLPAK